MHVLNHAIKKSTMNNCLFIEKMLLCLKINLYCFNDGSIGLDDLNSMGNPASTVEPVERPPSPTTIPLIRPYFV